MQYKILEIEAALWQQQFTLVVVRLSVWSELNLFEETKIWCIGLGFWNMRKNV